MLLRRVMQHIRDQNWFAVGIDFVIVVVGVFIGIQVSNWNDARARQLDAQTSRERLVADLRTDLDAFSVRRQFYDEIFDAALRVDSALRASPPEHVDETWRFVRDAWIAGTEWAFAPSAQVYQELKNAGDLDLIAVGTVQRQLRDYYEDSAREIGIVLTFKSAYRDVASQLIEGQVAIALADCLSGELLNPSAPGNNPDLFFSECPPPENFELVAGSAARLYESEALRGYLNQRLSDLSGLRSLLAYLDRQASALILGLEASQ